jgi:GTPase SAR1 family protein
VSDLPFPLDGNTLIVGPSGVGKTRLTARALEAWIDRGGPEGVVVLEFAPEVERDGRILGGRLDRFTTVPPEAWVGVLEAHAPRAESERADRTAVELAHDNAERAERLLEGAPDPRAVFVNDATIPLQSDVVAADRLTSYCDRAECAVLNAFESDELGTDDPVSRRERDALAALRSWADRTVALE